MHRGDSTGPDSTLRVGTMPRVDSTGLAPSLHGASTAPALMPVPGAFTAGSGSGHGSIARGGT